MCDQAATNMKALGLLGATLGPLGGEESHCFLVDGGRTIPIIFYVPHLVKSIRNNLFKHDLKVNTINTAITFLTHKHFCNGFITFSCMKMNGMTKT